MSRTKRLMTAVTTSLLLTGPIPTHASQLSGTDQTASQPDDSWKTDPKVEKAADSIHDWLKGTTPADAKTADEIAKKFPKFGSSLVEEALKRLIWQGDIRRVGNGTPDSPYSYFEHRSGGSGG